MKSFLRWLVQVLLPFFMRLEVVGRENFPQHGPYILVTNHLSAYDTPLLFHVCPHPIRAFAADKHRAHPFFGTLLSWGGSIWVRRGEIDRQALREALAWLDEGGVLGMAPEGTRARGVYALQGAKTGAAYLASRGNVPLVPVGLTGTERIKEELPHLRRAQVRVTVGKPFWLPGNGRPRGAELDQLTDLIMQQIAALLPPEYRGVYAE